MIVIGIDPGTSKCGVAVWALDGPRERLIACFALVPPKGQTAFARIKWIESRLRVNLDALGLQTGADIALVAEHLIGASVPKNDPLDTVLVMLHSLAIERKWEYVEYAPRQWRAVVRIRGGGEPDKDAVQWAMEASYPDLCHLRDVPGGMDAIEAAAIGRYHCDQRRVGLVGTGGRR